MKLKLFIVIIIVIIAASAGLGGYSYWQKIKEDRFLSANKDTKDAYAIVKKRLKDIQENKNDYDAWMSLAFHWKGIGEVTRKEEYLRRAVRIYDEVIARWGNKAYLPFVNQANVFIFLKEYKKAESNLKIANEIDPGEQSLYIALAELYENYMQKDRKDVEAVYKNGLKRVIGGGNLILSYASYLNDIGDYAESLKYYKMLAQAYPENSGYQTLVKELEGKTNNVK